MPSNHSKVPDLLETARRQAFFDAYAYFKKAGSVDVLSELYYAAQGHEFGSVHIAVNEND